MKILLQLLIVFPCFAGEVLFKLPKEAELLVNGKSVQVEPDGGEIRRVQFDDSQLVLGSNYYYRIEIRSSKLQVPIKEEIKLQPYGTITADFRDRFKEKPTGKESVKKEPPKKVPHFYTKNEALEELYLEYTANAVALKKEELRLDDKEQKYKCQIWTVPKANHLDREVVLDGTNAGAGRFVHLAMNDLVKDEQEKYLLTRKENGWRGSDSKESATLKQSISAQSIVKLYRLNIGLAEQIGGSAFTGPVSSTEVRTDGTLCINANGDNPTELYIELGKKMGISYLDKGGKEISPENLKDGVGVYAAYSGVVTMTKQLDAAELAKTILFNHDGNHSLPESHCYRDFSKESLTLYRTTALGFCSLSKGK